MTASKIDQKITGVKVKTDETPPPTMPLEREEVLQGATYKIKNPASDHAIYITINNLNDRPYEIFVSSKCPESYSWLLTFTRMMSALFRTGIDPTFMIEELKGVIDPKGGYYAKGLGFIPSVQAHIAIVLEKHMRTA